MVVVSGNDIHTVSNPDSLIKENTMNDAIVVVITMTLMALIAMVLLDLRKKPEKKDILHRPGDLARVQQRFFGIGDDKQSEKDFRDGTGS